MEVVTFGILAGVLVLGSLRVVTAASPLRSALALIVCQVALAGLYVSLSAPFVASMQILLYAGAVMVLFVFVIMLLNLGDDPPGSKVPFSALRWVAGASLVGLAGKVVQLCFVSPLPSGYVNGSVHHVGSLMLNRYAFSFEAVSMLLLTAVVGAVVLSVKRLT